MIWFLAASVVTAVGGLAAFLYSLRRGQFDDVEEAKYQMFREDDSK